MHRRTLDVPANDVSMDPRECEVPSEAMADQLSNLQHIRKPAIRSKGGIVAAQSRIAAEIGAEVLAAGGGAMVLYRAREDRFEVIDYGMRAPGSLRVEDYPLTGGVASDIFPWARV